MFDFIFILLFGKVVFLANISVDVQGTFSIDLEKPISALTPGAKIEIDVSSMINYEPGSSVKEFRKKVKEMFPPGSIQAVLVPIKGKDLTLEYAGNFGFNRQEVMIYLDSSSGVLKGKKIKKIIIFSSVKIQDAKLFWKNYLL